MTQTTNPEMLMLARELRGLTQAQLSELSGIDQGSISRYEGGLKDIPVSDLDRIAQALRFPTDFFSQPGRRYGADVAEIFHRKRNSLPAGQLKRIHAQLNVFRLNTERLLEQIRSPKHYQIPQLNVREYNGDVEYVAALVRSAWHIPATEHIPNMIRLLEAAYCFIHAVDFDTSLIDETVQWCEPMRPVILINKRAPGDRLRFTLAHVLGHLVMHHYREPYEGMEDEANQFAGAFLMPADEIRAALNKKVTLERLLQLKPYWKVSVQALIQRAVELEIITEARKTTLYQTLSREGYLRNEPLPIPQEQPTSFKRLIQLYRENRNLTTEELARLTRISEEDFRSWYLPDEQVLPRLVYTKSQGQIIPKRRSALVSDEKESEVKNVPPLEEDDDLRKTSS